MVLLEFLRDSATIAEDRELNLCAADAGMLQKTCFIMPVRLNVGGTELLEIPAAKKQRIWVDEPNGHSLVLEEAERKSAPWLPLPILDVASVGGEKIRDALENGWSIYDLPDVGANLRLESSGNEVRIHSTINGRTASARFEELSHAFEEFASKVRDALHEEVSELSRHPYWGKWLRKR